MVIPDLSHADIALIGFGGSTPAPVRIFDVEGIVVFITCHNDVFSTLFLLLRL
jgi:hypothetical protein